MVTKRNAYKMLLEIIDEATNDERFEWATFCMESYRRVYSTDEEYIDIIMEKYNTRKQSLERSQATV